MILTVPRHPLIVRRAPVLPNGIADYLHQRIEFDGTSGLTRTASALTALEIGEVVFSHPAKARIFQTPKADAHAVSESPTLFVLFDDPIIFAPHSFGVYYRKSSAPGVLSRPCGDAIR